MTLSHIQALESIGFEWDGPGATTTWKDRKWDGHSAIWEDRLSELADDRKICLQCA
jgi:hypothetical protein